MKHNLSNNKKKNNNTIVTAAKVHSLTTILVIAIGVCTPLTALGSSERLTKQTILGPGVESAIITFDREISAVLASEEVIYIAWSTNETENGNEEVMFRTSNDGGATFNDTINLSNTPNAHSWKVEIDVNGSDLIVTWWETNQTSNTPVAKISSDGGQTFSPMLRLSTSGTISSGVTTADRREEAEETVEEEAVGEPQVAE
jgi:hypothetical protein